MKVLLGMWLVSLYSVGIYQVTMTHGYRWPSACYQFLDKHTDTLLLHRNTELAIRPIAHWRQSFC